jgi:hypothetical protein
MKLSNSPSAEPTKESSISFKYTDLIPMTTQTGTSFFCVVLTFTSQDRILMVFKEIRHGYSHRNGIPSGLVEMRSAFGSGAVVVNVITGKPTQL